MERKKTEEQLVEAERERIKREAGITPGRGERYISPGGFIKIPTRKEAKPRKGGTK